MVCFSRKQERIFQSTLQSLYSMICHNTILYVTEFKGGPQKCGHTNHRNTGILPKYRNTREKYRHTYERRLLKTPILALINPLSNIMST